MGQQETMTVAAAEGKGGEAMLLRRMILVLAAAAVMAAMIAVMAAPAFARSDRETEPGEAGACIKFFLKDQGLSGKDAAANCTPKV
jgi:hypothetical protein